MIDWRCEPGESLAEKIFEFTAKIFLSALALIALAAFGLGIAHLLCQSAEERRLLATCHCTDGSGLACRGTRCTPTLDGSCRHWQCPAEEVAP